MATIGTAIRLNDMMTAPLRSITNAMNMMLSTWTSLESATADGLNVGDVEAIRTELNKATTALDQMGNEQEEFNRKVNEGTSAADGLTNAIRNAVVALGLAKVAKDAVDYASDLQEVQNVVDVSFGQSSVVIDEWAKTTLNSFGLSELSAKQFAGTMGAMLNSSGLTGNAVSEMSMKIAELAGDMASFYNLSGEDAFAKIRSGISGETEPLKQLGINMSVANLEAYALSQGISTAYNEMSQAEQVTLRYNYLLQATANAQGDFARTSDSFANQQKLLTENWRAFTGELASDVLPVLALVLAFLNDSITFISENWSIVAPILLGIVSAIGLYTVALLIHKATLAGTAFMEAFHAAQAAIKGGATLAEAAATTTATGAQVGFNAALMACPLTWILLLIIAVIAAIYAVVAAINKVTGSTVSATGIIVGSIMTALAFVGNIFVAAINFVIDVFVVLWNFIASFVNFFANVFTDPIGSIARLFFDLVDTVLSLLQTLASAIDTLFGSNLAGSVQGWRDSLGGWVDETFGKGEEVMVKMDSESMHLNRFVYGDAWDFGYGIGEGIEDSVGGFFSGDGGSIYDSTENMDDIPTYDEIANNTDRTASALEITNENLKYLRDSAEQETVNRFTTAEVRVEMTNNNNISSNMDLDGVVDYMVTGVQEALERTAEGVHS